MTGTLIPFLVFFYIFLKRKLNKKNDSNFNTGSYCHFSFLLHGHHRHPSLTVIANINPAVPQILQHNIIMPSLFNGLHLLVHAIQPNFNLLFHFFTSQSLTYKRQRINTSRVPISSRATAFKK
jgi:hypothetical protein